MTSLTLTMPKRHRLSRQAVLAWVGVGLLLALVLWRLGPVWWAPEQGGAKDIAVAALVWRELLLPRLLAALSAGAALGVAGVLFQSLTRNPLAAPDLLGVSGGAQLGVLAMMLVPALMGMSSVPVLFVYGLGAAALVMLTAGGWRASPLQLILAGTACSLLFTAISNMVLTASHEGLDGAALWSSGIMYQSDLGQLLSALAWCLPVVVAIPWLVRPLEVMALGDESAHMLGVSLSKARFATAICGTVLTAVAVALAGPLGSLGLIAPNLLRAAGVQRLRVLLPLSALWAAVILLATDSVVQSLGLDSTMSTGMLVAILGTPLLLLLIYRYQQQHMGGNSVGVSRQPQSHIAWFVPLLLVLVALLLTMTMVAMAVGSEWLGPSRWWAAWQGQDAVAGLLMDLRVPRVLVAMVAGAMLAASGALLQSVVRNPLAGPEVMGITQGAGLGVLLVLVWIPLAGRPTLFAAALTGGAIVLLLTVLLNRRHRLAPLPVALTGIALGGLCMALSQWVIVQSSVQPARFMVWMVGGTYGRSWSDVQALLPCLLVCLPGLWLLIKPLELLALGEENAAALGVPVAGLRVVALMLGTALASAAVATVGPVAFVGLMMPHLAHLLGFGQIRYRLPVAMLLGALLMAVADVLGRQLLAPVEVPAGVTTALLGAPYLLGMLLLGQRKGKR